VDLEEKVKMRIAIFHLFDAAGKAFPLVIFEVIQNPTRKSMGYVSR
jgi:hypothetical protein